MRAASPARYLLRNGGSAALPDGDPLAGTPYLVAADLDGERRESRIYLAAPVGIEEIVERFGDAIVTDEVVAWDGAAVRGVGRDRLGALVLRERRIETVDPGRVAAALVDAVRAGGLALLPWTREADRLRERMIFLRTVDTTGAGDPWPDISDDHLLATLEAWLAPHLAGTGGEPPSPRST